jgi:hypothetical protein
MPQLRPIVSHQPPRQFALSLDPPALNGMTTAERQTAIRRLAHLLLEAAGADLEHVPFALAYATCSSLCFGEHYSRPNEPVRSESALEEAGDDER